MEPAPALGYLRNTLLPDRSDPALLAHWTAAKARVNWTPERPGHPDVIPIPADHDQHVNFFISKPEFNDSIAPLQGRFALVEIEPLLAYQFDIVLDRANSHTAGSAVPTIAEMLPVCLPHAAETISFRLQEVPNGVVLQSRSLNFRITGAIDARGGSMAGINFGVPSNLVQVVRFNGRCYLRNGFHRAFGYGKRGATHIPCLFLEASDWAQVGARGGTETFERALLESAAPPTLAHYCRGSAYELPLRTPYRVIQVTWSEYVLYEGD